MPERIRQVFAGASAVRLLVYAPGEQQDLHSHDHATISLVLRGRVTETDRHENEEASALSVAFKPAGVPHADRIGGQGATLVQIELGVSDESMVQAAGSALRLWRWEHATEAAQLMLGLAGVMNRGSIRKAEREIRLRFPRVLRALGAGPRQGRRSPRPWLASAASRLESRATVREVAAGAGVHPVYLARAFRRCFGESPLDYRRRLRFREGVSLLTDTRDALADVAAHAGFSDQAHMTRELVRRIGLTPREFRRLACAV
jgi:AraC family transcriptional regulator